MIKRTLVIGDIHGALKALEQVLERGNVTSDDKLIFLGDYVDGWSDSYKVIGFLNDLSAKNECVFIIGNHEISLRVWLKTGFVSPTWLRHGGEVTVEGYKSVKNRQKHIDFLDRTRPYYIDEENRLFIHAGFTSREGILTEPEQQFMYKDRFFWRQTVLAHEHPETQQYWLEVLSNYKEIYIGHTPVLVYSQTKPMHCCNVWNMDTGAGFDGFLSMMDVVTKELWQSDRIHTLYPDEKGRRR